MSNYTNRLDQIENVVAPDRAALECIVFGDDDVYVAVAKLRSSQNWPDDGQHPVKVMRVRWGRG